MSRTVGWLPTTPILTSLLCDRLDSWIRLWLSSLVLALGSGLGSRLRIHLLDSVLTLGFGLLVSVSWIRSPGFGFLFSFSQIRSLVFVLSDPVSCIRSRLLSLVSTSGFGFDSWIRS